MERVDYVAPTGSDSLVASVSVDEKLLDEANEISAATEYLRIWEPAAPMVVTGRSSRAEREVDAAECERRGIPVVQRSSGGAAIVTGPGCLMYAVVLSFSLRPKLRDITRAHEFVLDTMIAALQPLVGGRKIERAGTSDLVLANGDDISSARKFSGNSLRVKRTHCLYHGTLLYDFDLSLLSKCLQMPPRKPEYRGERSHTDFVANLPVSREALTEAIESAWPCDS